MDQGSEDSYVVTDRATADALRVAGPLLVPFAEGHTSIADAARHAGVPLYRMQYWVRKFVACGLLVEDHVQPRVGRPIQHYRPVARSFAIGYELLPPNRLARTLARREVQFLKELAAADPRVLDAQDLHIALIAESDGGVRYRCSFRPRDGGTGPSLPPMLLLALERSLTRDEAVMIHDRLRDLATMVSGLPVPEAGEPFHFELRMAPAIRD